MRTPFSTNAPHIPIPQKNVLEHTKRIKIMYKIRIKDREHLMTYWLCLKIFFDDMIFVIYLRETPIWQIQIEALFWMVNVIWLVSKLPDLEFPRWRACIWISTNINSKSSSGSIKHNMYNLLICLAFIYIV